VVIYIHNFLHESEIEAILASGLPLLKPSTVTRHGTTVTNEYRTSWSAKLSGDDPAVRCIMDRAWSFMGSMLAQGKDQIESPQLVRYREGQKFNMHTDWFEAPLATGDGRQRVWNRAASFFAILEDNCTAGETYFPHIKPLAKIPKNRENYTNSPWKLHKDGGLVFPPVRGNALFWVNLLPNGRGDTRVEHAGLPVKDGIKSAINVWAKVYGGPDAWDDLQ
jgi:prolyl 4-hydroxylase